MAKPICIIEFDADTLVNQGHIASECSKLASNFEVHMPDYYVYVIPNFNKEEPIPVMNFKVYYEKDFTDVQYEELKSIITEKLQEYKSIKL